MEKKDNITFTLSDGKTVTAPTLAMVPIPDLKIDEVNVDFDMEVTASSSSSEDREGDKENTD